MEFNDLSKLDIEERFDIISSYVSNIKRASKTNSIIKDMRAIVKGRTSLTEAVVSGIYMIESIQHSSVKNNNIVICLDDIYTIRAQKVIYEVSLKADNVLCVNKSTFDLLGVKKNSNGIAAHITLNYYKITEAKTEGIHLVVDSLELPGNIGTLMRTLDGAGLSSIIITNSKVRLNNPTLLAASRASFSNLRIIVDDVDNIANWAKENHIEILLADTTAEKTYTQTDLKKSICFVVGCERYGINKRWYQEEHRLIKIPMLGKCDSLNVGVAGSILIYEALRQQSS
ncbi:MAG: hypothetical protein KAQ68_05840 [Clostridiales bacterium]|nr:hypothetical protein [Clostridiales bacterium]